MGTTYPIKDKELLEQMKLYYVEHDNPRNYCLIVIGLNTALRISDILDLKWKDVYQGEPDLYRKHISITEQKTGKRSMVALNAAVIRALSVIRKEQADSCKPDSYIFCNSRDRSRPITRYQAYRIIKKAAVHSGLEEHISCHSLRKTFGYFAWKQGVPPAMLMNIYNHSSYQITKRYLCIEQDDRDDVFMKINL